MSDVIAAHAHSIRHRPETEASERAGCFYCLAIYPPAEVADWVDDVTGETALCPRCGIDSVIGDAWGHPITEDFLKRMNAHWFRP
jgi:hypothetical protein